LFYCKNSKPIYEHSIQKNIILKMKCYFKAGFNLINNKSWECNVFSIFSDIKRFFGFCHLPIWLAKLCNSMLFGSTTTKRWKPLIWYKWTTKEFANISYALGQCFSTFFGSQHPFWVKTFGGTLTLVNLFFETPLKLIVDKFYKESQQIIWKSNVLRENIEKIQYLAAPLGSLHGTPVENHCTMVSLLVLCQ